MPGPLHFASSALASMFVARVKRLIDKVHPVIIPFSIHYQSNVSPRCDFQFEITVVIKNDVSDLPWDLMAFEGSVSLGQF